MFNFIEHLDISIIKYLYTLQNPLLNKIMIFFTTIGDVGLIWIIISLILLFTKKYKKVGIISIISLAICLLIVNLGLKPLVHRERPFNIIENLTLLIKEPHDYSFPSGHTAASFVMVYIFYKYIKKYFPIVLIVALLISFSRLYLTVHFPSDVIAGIFLGLFSGYLGNELYIYIKNKI